MRRSTIAAIAAVSTFALTQVASAADLPRKAPAYTPPPSPVFSWTGFYIGGNVGGGWADRDVTFTPNDPAAAAFFVNAPRPPMSFRTDGVLGGVQIGYNWQFHPNWLVGLETDFDWSGMRESISILSTAGNTPGLWTADEHIKWFGTVRGRLGWLPFPNLLLYGTGGFAYGNVEHSGNWTFTNPNAGFGIGSGGFTITCGLGAGTNLCFDGSSNNTVAGWTAGGGVEYALTQHWSIKGEYLYVSLENKLLTETAVAPAPGSRPASFNLNFDHMNFNVARAGINYRF